MDKIAVTLPDGKVLEAEKGISGMEFIKTISMRLYKEAVACKIDGVLKDLWTSLERDCSFEVVTFSSDEGKKVYWHTTSHILAQAVKRLFGDKVKLGIGPAIDNGFYYDFDIEESITREILEKIEEEMQKIIKEDLKIERFELSREEAIKLMQQRGENYKVELINDIPEGEIISFYRQGEFVDLCTGPHLPSTGRVKAFKLLSVAGAYWRGNSKNKMLQRIYGISFEKKSELDEYLKKLEEAKKRDHNRIGRELEIFTTSEVVGQGLPLLMPKGAKILQILQRFVEDEEEKRGYLLTKTPYMAKSDLYKISGHWDHYRDGMFVIEEDENEVLALRPMTCPFQFLIYNSKQRSYRDLPIRYSETSTLFRNESSGEMHGLIRVRQFTLSDAHIICRPDQVEEEFKGVLDLIQYIMKILGIENDIWYRFSRWDPNNKEKYIDNPEAWEKTENDMKNILDKLGINYKEAKGEAAFYGPKLDIQFKNVYGKEDTIITIQIDFALAERFDMTYVDRDGQKKRPIIIHRSSIGCYERTLAMLIEKYNGAFPLWLAPVQIRVIPVSDNFNEYAKNVARILKENGFRVEEDYRSETVGYKIRDAQLQKIPYMVIVGEKEQKENTVAVRDRKKGDLGSFTIEDFIAMVKEKVDKKVIE
ncbi:threonyl-tRNA synthetase [Caldicellulosiruptor bescii]|uniref:Threonine--tRNA ligase n=2 Tax=Caldicellulosiruptor bescii TaxID=31899 RepID=B9MQC4_CALBD|nr:threonine--tRNA ligase [Caldicellulosiruptor bescii]ACM59916.1 threonyl-tRNA synthetase [Caldicellulosiruptor bescii DSM 6725]PBC87326.1 threonyl-tRNA synthetase [Caldicellulosiruptor bescii]PBC90266.1 threonyl-tRNA synthetase [Caldicellulosiruptor bescii]PBD04306.1 threonyl-tRNA synthetase [Caldicellulosiruptor bescii]PBD06063.1 threonyl-tRNA synthetase [Caldicellulosiruptor bescii]